MTTRNYTPNRQARYMRCTCCGADMKNTPEENACYHDKPYPQDDGFGQCRACFGQDKDELTFGDIKNMTEAQTWKFLGWAEERFYKTRFDVMEKALNEKNAQHFKDMVLWKKLNIIQGAIEKGLII